MAGRLAVTRLAVAAAVGALIAAPSVAQAALIGFDDLPAGVAIAEQYAAQGVRACF